MGLCGDFHASRTATIRPGSPLFADGQHQRAGRSVPAATASRGKAIPRFPPAFGAGSGSRSAVGLAEVDHQADHGQGLIRHPADAEPAHLDQAGQGRGRTHQQPSVRGLDMGAVVGDEPRERQQALPGRLQQRQRQPRLARTGRALDQHGARADQHRGSVDRRGSRHHTVGRRTVKRAPSTCARHRRSRPRRCGSRPTAGRGGPR